MNKSKDIMTSKLITTKANDQVKTAYQLMQNKGIRHLPVMDERNTIVGIISDRDVQRAMTVKKINHIQQNVEIDPDLLVEDFMSWPVHVISETTPIKRVAEEMLSEKVSAFLVQDNQGHTKGIITTDDLLKLFLTDEMEAPKIGFKPVGHFFQARID